MTSLADRVAKGASLLDEERPGWENEIDAGEISLFSTTKCPLGQIYGSLWRGPLPPGVELEDYGFNLTQHEADLDVHGFGAQFKILWHSEIERRRDEAT